MKKIISVSLLSLFMTSAWADTSLENIDVEEGNVVALKVGTLGLGIDYSIPVDNDFSVRFNLNGATYSEDDITVDNIDYSGELNLFTVGALLDYYPYEENTFRLTGGAYYNGNNFKGSSRPTIYRDIKIGENSYNANVIAKLDADLDFNPISPYIGIGWGNKTTVQKGWGFSLDIGVLYQGEAEVNLTPDINPLLRGTFVETEINRNIEKESKQIIEDIQGYTFYPVIMMGASYKF